MDTKRVLEILITELSLDNLKLQETLQEQINSSEKIKTRIRLVKKTLEKLVINESMIKKFKQLIEPENNK